MNAPTKYRVTDSITHTFPLTGESVTVEVSNTRRAFAWRMRIGNAQQTPWTTWYQRILTLKSNATGAIYGYATEYWADAKDDFPVEKPFLMATAESLEKLMLDFTSPTLTLK